MSELRDSLLQVREGYAVGRFQMDEKLTRIRDRILTNPKYAFEMSKQISVVRALFHDPAMVRRVRDDILFFCRFVLGFEPTEYQAKFLTDPHQFVVARWCRQSGKSFSVGALLLHIALTNPHVHIGIVAPSLRQSKNVIQKMGGFIKRLERGIGGNLIKKARKTAIECGDGAVIEALPNNPDTVRGPTLFVVYCDEWGFVKNDEEMYDAILFTLGTTNGRLIATSTPSIKNSLFYKMCFDPNYEDFSRHHINWRQAVEPYGPLKPNILEKIKKQLLGDPWRWQREMEAEFAEDVDRFFPLELIIKCQDPDPLDSKYKDWDYYPFEHMPLGEFYIGADLGKKVDFSVVAVIEKRRDGKFRLVHLKQFPLETPYASVIGYVKAICDRYKNVGKIAVDRTGVGEYIVEDMEKAIPIPTEGVLLTVPSKQEVLGNLKRRMEEGNVLIPYDQDLFAEMNAEQFELMKSGQNQFSHPSGTHDDRLWALALAVYATRGVEPSQPPIAISA